MATFSLNKQRLPVFLSVILGLFIISLVFVSVARFVSSTDKASASEIVPADQYVGVEGKNLTLQGEKYQFTGVNAYNIATYPGSNAGCGSYVSDLDSFFSQLRPNAMVRMWAFQGTITTNTVTKKTDWTGLDRVVNAAQRNGKKVILVLGDQSGHCDDGHWKDNAWYGGGYKQSYNDYGNGLTPIAYLDYVKLIVTRYKDSPAVAMWEPMNEPNASDCTTGKGFDCYAQLTCPDEAAAAGSLRSFFDTVGGTIKSIDSHHLVSSGTIGDGQCGTVYEDYQYVHESPGIDVASFHDYHRDDQPMPGDQWNGLQKRLNQMSQINKPLIVGEVGTLASDTGTGCMTYAARKDKLKAKMDAQFAAGIAGFMPWSLTLGVSSGCNYDVVANDPIIKLLREYPVAMNNVVPLVSITSFPTPTPTPVDREAPSKPAGLKASGVSAKQLTLSWNASTDNVKVVRYDIFRNYAYVTSTTGTNFTQTNLSPGTKYMYYVKAKDGVANYSAASDQLSVMTLYIGPTPTLTPTPTPTKVPVPDTQNPAAPTNLTATSPVTRQVSLKWTAAIDNVGVVRYEIYRDSSYVTATTGTSFTNDNLVSGKQYTYYLKSRDAAGNSSGASIKITVKVK